MGPCLGEGDTGRLRRDAASIGGPQPGLSLTSHPPPAYAGPAGGSQALVQSTHKAETGPLGPTGLDLLGLLCCDLH